MRRQLSLVLCTLAVGCGGDAPAATAKTLVHYERTGGFARERHTVTVSTRGAVRADRRRSQLSDRALRTLRRTVRAARFGSLKARYAPRTPVADGLTETVRHGGRTVTVQTGGHPPERLRRLLERMARLLSSP
jgi:hypothetical protein